MLALRVSLCGGLLLAAAGAPLVRAQRGPDRVDIDRAQVMLRDIRDDLKKHYYDPAFHGMDVDARFKAADDKLKQADSVGQLWGIIAQALTDQALERAGLTRRAADRYPDELSGGERQRVAIARALVCRPEVLICDEVTSALDVSVQATILELLKRLQSEEGLSMVFITHNLAIVRNVADRMIVMHDGSIVEGGEVATVLDHPKHSYTERLIADTPAMPAPAAA